MNGSLNSKDRPETCLYKMMYVFIIISVICLCCNVVEAGLRPASTTTTIYINDKTGNDKYPGTIKKPLKTISEVNKRFQKKPASLYFAGGQVFEGNLMLQDKKDSEKDTIVIGSYGGGRASINGGDNEAVRIEKCDYFRIENIDLKGSGRLNGNTTDGISLTRSTNFSIENVRTEGFQKSGVYLYDCRQAVVKNVFAFNNGFCGINIMGSERGLSGKILIQDCRAENNPGDPTILDNHSGNGIRVGVTDSVIIDHCTATNNGWDMPRLGNGPVGIWAWESDHVLIQYCISYRNKTSNGGKDGGGFDFDGGVTNSILQYCLSYENQGAGYGLFQYPGASDWSNNIIRYCVSIDDAHTTEGAGSFFIWNGSGESRQLTNCYIYNNVAYNSSAPVISFENASKHENFIFGNNIFIGTGQMIDGKNKGSMFLGNVWWGSGEKIKFMDHNNLSEWAAATGQETLKGLIVGCQVDPGLKGPFLTDITDPYMLNALTGYTLFPDTHIKNRGLDTKTFFVTDLPERDFYGNPVPLGPGREPGIHEIE